MNKCNLVTVFLETFLFLFENKMNEFSEEELVHYEPRDMFYSMYTMSFVVGHRRYEDYIVKQVQMNERTCYPPPCFKFAGRSRDEATNNNIFVGNYTMRGEYGDDRRLDGAGNFNYGTNSLDFDDFVWFF